MSRRFLAPFLLGILLAACGGRGGSRPHVVLVLVDQLRQDAADTWMSETRALAGRGIVFANARSVAPWTYPSVVSLFSGLYPQQHGADGHADGKLLTTFSADVPLLPQLLRDAGYHASGFVTNPFLHEWNPIHLAFDHYDASFIRNPGNRRGLGDLVWTERMYGDSVNAAVRAYFDARTLDAPEFTYVHYIDVHGRKEGPQRWQGAPFAGDYASAVRFVDQRIEELYDYFSARYAGNLLFLVTSDHGQDLDDDLAIGEGEPARKRKVSMHDFNLRIPLYVLPGTPVPGARHIEDPVASIDLVPTLCEWLDLELPIEVPGKSLLPLIEGGELATRDRALYARMSAFGRLDDCMIHHGTKFIRYREPGSGRVLMHAAFDLDSDPREAQNLGSDLGDEERLLLEREAGDHGVLFRADFEVPDGEVLEQLQELGYLGDTGEDADGDESEQPSATATDSRTRCPPRR